MPLPLSLAKVTVSTGPWVDSLGFPLSGHATVRASTLVTHVASGTPIVDAPVDVALDSTGSATTRLPATDAPGLSSTGWTYLIEFHFVTRSGRYVDIPAFSFQLPRAVENVDLDTLVPVDTSTGVQVSVPGVTSVGGLSGVITTGQLEALLGGGGAGGGLTPTDVQTADCVADVGDFLEVDATAGPVTVTAPAAEPGQTFTVIKIDATDTVVTVDFGDLTVNGDDTADIVSQWAGATFLKGLTQWRILSYMPGSTSTGGGGGGGVTVISAGDSDDTYTLDGLDGGNALNTYTLDSYNGGPA